MARMSGETRAAAARGALRAALLGAALLPAAAGAVQADEARREADPQATEVLSRLDERLARISALRGSFVQTFVSSGLGVPQAEEGTFAIRRPDLMRWEYRKPERKLAVSDGVHTWLYLPEEKVVYRGTVRGWKQAGAFSILAGGRLGERFDAVAVHAQGAGRSGDIVVELVPKAPSEQYESLRVEFDPATLTLGAITAIDAMGSRVSILVSGLEENPRLGPELFTFEPPRGVEVIDQAESSPADLLGETAP